MKVEVSKKTIITLELYEEEARWLKAVMQNPLCDNETQDNAKMRAALWEALDDIVV